MEIRIRPCPFCGMDNTECVTVPGVNFLSAYVKCPDCLSVGPEVTIQADDVKKPRIDFEDETNELSKAIVEIAEDKAILLWNRWGRDDD